MFTPFTLSSCQNLEFWNDSLLLEVNHLLFGPGILALPCFDKYSGFGLLFTHWFAVFPFRLFVPLQTDFTWYLDLYLKCPLLEHSGYTFRFTHLDFFTTQRSGLKPKPSPHILRAKTKARLRWRPEMQLWDTTAETWIRPRMYHPENFWNDY